MQFHNQYQFPRSQPQMPFQNFIPRGMHGVQQQNGYEQFQINSFENLDYAYRALESYKSLPQIRKKFASCRNLNSYLDLDKIPKTSRFFVMRSNNDEDIHKVLHPRVLLPTTALTSQEHQIRHMDLDLLHQHLPHQGLPPRADHGRARLSLLQVRYSSIAL